MRNLYADIFVFQAMQDLTIKYKGRSEIIKVKTLCVCLEKQDFFFHRSRFL